MHDPRVVEQHAGEHGPLSSHHSLVGWLLAEAGLGPWQGQSGIRSRLLDRVVTPLTYFQKARIMLLQPLTVYVITFPIVTWTQRDNFFPPSSAERVPDFLGIRAARLLSHFSIAGISHEWGDNLAEEPSSKGPVSYRSSGLVQPRGREQFSCFLTPSSNLPSSYLPQTLVQCQHPVPEGFPALLCPNGIYNPFFHSPKMNTVTLGCKHLCPALRNK